MSKETGNSEEKFGDFDLDRQLTEFEMDHFDEFMLPISDEERDAMLKQREKE
jgi:hypothetical protein